VRPSSGSSGRHDEEDEVSSPIPPCFDSLLMQPFAYTGEASETEEKRPAPARGEGPSNRPFRTRSFMDVLREWEEFERDFVSAKEEQEAERRHRDEKKVRGVLAYSSLPA
jgi:hypothetical protein